MLIEPRLLVRVLPAGLRAQRWLDRSVHDQANGGEGVEHGRKGLGGVRESDRAVPAKNRILSNWRSLSAGIDPRPERSPCSAAPYATTD